MPRYNSIKPEDELATVKDYASGMSLEATATVHHTSQHKVRQLLGKRGVPLRRWRDEGESFKYDVHFFDKIDAENKAYFLGWMFSDGNVSKDSNAISINLKNTDGHILSAFSRAICRGKDLSRIGDLKGIKDYCRRININSRSIREALIRHGCIPQKSLTLRFPRVSKDMLPHFIRGYFDGDGCFTVRSGRNASSPKQGVWKIVSSVQFCECLSWHILRECRSYTGIRHPSKNRKVGSLQYTRNVTIKALYRYLYDNATIYLARKHDKMKRYVDQIPSTP